MLGPQERSLRSKTLSDFPVIMSMTASGLQKIQKGENVIYRMARA